MDRLTIAVGSSGERQDHLVKRITYTVLNPFGGVDGSQILTVSPKPSKARAQQRRIRDGPVGEYIALVSALSSLQAPLLAV